jgi:hypothetical protein
MPFDLSRARLALVVLAWAGATLFGLLVAAGTRIGPIVVNLSYNHGIHLGDLIAFGGAYVVAGLVTLSLITPRRVLVDR